MSDIVCIKNPLATFTSSGKAFFVPDTVRTFCFDQGEIKKSENTIRSAAIKITKSCKILLCNWNITSRVPFFSFLPFGLFFLSNLLFHWWLVLILKSLLLNARPFHSQILQNLRFLFFSKIRGFSSATL